MPNYGLKAKVVALRLPGISPAVRTLQAGKPNSLLARFEATKPVCLQSRPWCKLVETTS